MNDQRLCDKDHPPSVEEIHAVIGSEAKEVWLRLTGFVENNYNHEAELNYGGKNYGWNVRYRKSGKTLFSMFPERNCFTVLLVLGKKEADKYNERQNEFGGYFKAVFDGSPQYHDGRWLWIKINDTHVVDDIERMILIKKKPSKVRDGCELDY